ncbi:glutathione S-transferase family protein [Ferruginivarius sediminum]|uniref:Glutathione S-transferase family protein n=1 Tax=Ferruginivarius sediminum TaxID=2661937 RepID=A0A369T7G1_9PROT|nr:glutathione S-transferase family protein [Ferruginivarius sediminum]RDD61263.1 glutathione S-transferase family protein [Ferruginivarius sediminum]
MGLLIYGVWHDQWYDTKKHGGRFVRQESAFRDWVTADGSSGFKAEPGRYHLYVCYACPWAHRTLIVRALKGLEDVISYDPVHWYMAENGWAFDAEHPDTVNGANFLHEVYTRAKPDYTGRVTVPTLWDRQQGTIVNNESAELIRMLNTEFNAFARHPELDLYPADLRKEIEAVNERVYHTVNNGVYKAGFATTQAAYEEAFDALFDTLDWLEERLGRQRYLAGDLLTEADIRLFTTLVRFDPVYVGHFKCNKRRIVDYPNLWGLTREIYQLPGVKQTVRFDHIKKHYYVSHAKVNPTQVVPKGPDIDFDAPHDRARLGGPGGLQAIARSA